MAFRNRFEAGRKLAAKLSHYRDASNVIVLALPRGGVPVGFEVAAALRVPLDVFLVRKLGMPRHEELAMGAVATGGVRVINDDIVTQFGIPQQLIDEIARKEFGEIARQERIFRRGRPAPALANQTVILVDDGLATGSTMRAAIESLRKQRPRWIVAAVPVGAAETCAEFREIADETICAVAPEQFRSVGAWYADFSQISDDEVNSLLEEAEHWRRSASGAFSPKVEHHVPFHNAT